MDVKKAKAIIFSPTYSTKAVEEEIVNEMDIHMDMVDLTCMELEEKEKKVGCNELAIFGAPVYGGRVPEIAVQRIKGIKGDNTPAIIFVTYGNRDYDDALLELKNTVEENGFHVFAAAAFVTEHNIMHRVATGRPDENDKKIICEFAKQAALKLNGITDISKVTLKVDGNIPYKQYNGIPMKPIASEECGACGKCAELCPVGAIPKDNPKETNTDICISCMRCIKVCPNHARGLDEKIFVPAENAFVQKCSDRREPKLFL